MEPLTESQLREFTGMPGCRASLFEAQKLVSTALAYLARAQGAEDALDRAGNIAASARSDAQAQRDRAEKAEIERDEARATMNRMVLSFVLTALLAFAWRALGWA